MLQRSPHRAVLCDLRKLLWAFGAIFVVKKRDLPEEVANNLYIYYICLYYSLTFHIIRISFHIIPSIPSWLHLHSIAAVLDAHLRSQAQPPQSWWGMDLIDLQEPKISAHSFFPIYTYQVWQSCFVKSLEPCKESSGARRSGSFFLVSEALTHISR